MPDSNWFFSTLAQCTAALIGMLGGMLVIRIMDYRDSYRLVESKRYLDDQLGNWRHNVLATISNAMQRAGGLRHEDKEVLREIYRLVEREEPYISLKFYKRFCNKLLQQTSLLQQEPFPAEPNVINKALSQYLVLGKDKIITLWERHNARLYPRSIYAMFVVLVALGGVGVIGPLTFLTGFHTVLFWLFLVMFVLLCLCVSWLLVDLAKTNRIQAAHDSNLLPYRRDASEGVMFTVETP